MANNGYIDMQTIANDAEFRGRCYCALMTQALFVMNNDAPTGSLLAYCNSVINGTVNLYAVTMSVLTASAVATAATIASLPGETAVTDAQILSAIAINFNAMAGVPG
jgi:hypothetical protein